ncbi:MAG: 3-deoxy-D-manno-octulosonic acid transferase [Desulfobacterales bacterium]|nr:3-deoxy-D-manno-octulosonic acid transferase [Desulfobacterales bacterium]
MPSGITEKTAFLLYDFLWRLVIPALRLNRRLADGFDQRVLKREISGPADLWIQAASVGESFLAWSILKTLYPENPVKIVLTTNTVQGMGILEKAVSDITPNTRGITAETAYFPFDRPSIMKKAVRKIQPRLMVLLETEIWPGHLSALKKSGCKIYVINGRLTEKYVKRYMAWPSLTRSLSPDRILAVSEDDASRFAAIFGKERVSAMPNIKFDRAADSVNTLARQNRVKQIIPADAPFLVLGSVRQEEEDDIEKIIADISGRHPETVIGLFPRHMHRIGVWAKTLDRLKIPWLLRSKTGPPVQKGSVILWDTFGELTMAYQLAAAVFVGGSLAPLGGQNFLEALLCGVIPVIGRYWESFSWVGREIVEQGLLCEVSDWKETADTLAREIEQPPDRKKVQEAALKYVKTRQGGTARACGLITEYLNKRVKSRLSGSTFTVPG